MLCTMISILLSHLSIHCGSFYTPNRINSKEQSHISWSENIDAFLSYYLPIKGFHFHSSSVFVMTHFYFATANNVQKDILKNKLLRTELQHYIFLFFVIESQKLNCWANVYMSNAGLFKIYFYILWGPRNKVAESKGTFVFDTCFYFYSIQF